MSAPWAEHVLRPNLKKLAAQLRTVDESQFVQLCHECIPELGFFVGPAEASPSEQSEHSAAKKEKLRTVGWAYADSLTRNSFDRLFEWAKAVLPSLEQQEAMLAQMAIHDLGKVTGFAKWIWQKTGEKESDDHDAVLLVAMQKLPVSLPSFAALPSQAQRDIIRGWSTALNVGHLLQAEGPPAILSGAKELLRCAGGHHAVEFYLLHALLDVAGVQGHVTLEGSPVLTEDLCQAFLLARDAVLLLQKPNFSIKDCYFRYLNERASRIGVVADWSAPVAFFRVLCMMRASDSKAVAMLQHSWAELPADDRSLLCHELLRTGIEPGQEAIVLYYAPQLLANAVRLRKEEGLTAALRLCVQIFAKAREQQRSNADQLFAARPVIVQINQHGKEGRATWSPKQLEEGFIITNVASHNLIIETHPDGCHWKDHLTSVMHLRPPGKPFVYPILIFHDFKSLPLECPIRLAACV